MVDAMCDDGALRDYFIGPQQLAILCKSSARPRSSSERMAAKVGPQIHLRTLAWYLENASPKIPESVRSSGAIWNLLM